MTMTKTRAALIAAIVLTTAATRAEDIPLPEHPRPDWERSEWMNLNGTWDFRYAGEADFSRKILVPFGWGSPASGVPDCGDTGIYRRNVTVPSAWCGKRVFLVVGASDHDTTVRFAGKTLGKHVGGYTPFAFELTDLVTADEEQPLEIEVWDPSPKAAHNGHYLYGKQGYGNARGIWQTVYLEARGKTYVKTLRLTPSIAGSRVRAFVAIDAAAEKPLTVELRLDGRTTPVLFAPGETSRTVEIPVDEPRLWTLDDPYLYEVTARIPAEAPWYRPWPRGATDEVKTYFGFREIGTGKNPNGDNYVTLNGKPVYLQLTLDQSYHPEGWYTFPSDEIMKNEILISKNLGLTGNRVHIKSEVPRKLYWADKLGVLIQADVPCAWGEASQAMFAEHWNCFEGMVARDFNHPCIYQWTLFNETWGLFTNRSLSMGLASGNGGKKREYAKWTQEAVRKAYRKAKALDPTRLVEDNSPCCHDHVETDVNTWHAYCTGYSWEGCVASNCRDTFVGSKANFIGGNVQNGAPMMNSECGNVWGYAGSTGDCDFTWDYHLMMNAFRRHLKCGGWLYTEHHDVCNEWNGYVRFDRTPKYDGLDELAGMTLRDFHAPAALFFAGAPGKETGAVHEPGARFSLPVGVSFTTDAYEGKKLTLRHRMWYYTEEGLRYERAEEGATGTFTAKSWQYGKLWDVAVRMPRKPTAGCIVFRLEADGEVVARNFYAFSTVEASDPVKPTVADWSLGTTNVLDGLKFNGFGGGAFEFELAAPAAGGVFRAELSAKRKYRKDFPPDAPKNGLDCMLGGGAHDRSRNANSYPQTSDDRYPANVKIFANGILVKECVLPDDPADHRGILSWLAQKTDRKLREAGSYGWLVEAEIPVEAVNDGKTCIRIESDAGLAVYGRRFGRYPLDPHIAVAR